MTGSEGLKKTAKREQTGGQLIMHKVRILTGK